MHLKVLTEQQQKLLPLLETFSDQYGLIGGTALALQLGHRESVDFDLITAEKLNVDGISNTIRKKHAIDQVLVQNSNEYTLLVEGVKLTFLHFPFSIKFATSLPQVILMPDLLTLAAMKAYALGRRAKWKDYVDLFFVFRQHSFAQVVAQAKSIFASEFSEKLFRQQLSYFADIDYSEEVRYLQDQEVSDEQVKQELMRLSLEK